MKSEFSMLSVLKTVQSAQEHRFRFYNSIEMEEHKYFGQALDAGFIKTTDRGRRHSSVGYHYYGAALTPDGNHYIKMNDVPRLRKLRVKLNPFICDFRLYRELFSTGIAFYSLYWDVKALIIVFS